MPRRSSSTSIDALVLEAMGDVISSAAEDITRAIAELAADQLTGLLESRVAKTTSRNVAVRTARTRRRPRGEMTSWVADRRARRVPTFVIELTGLKTKKQIVAKYGDNAQFEKGKAAPKVR